MTTNIHNQFSLGKFSDMLFVRQTPYVAAEQHPSLLASFNAWRARRKAEGELARLSDRDLADIGVDRQNISAAVRVRRNIRL